MRGENQNIYVGGNVFTKNVKLSAASAKKILFSHQQINADIDKVTRYFCNFMFRLLLKSPNNKGVIFILYLTTLNNNS